MAESGGWSTRKLGLVIGAGVVLLIVAIQLAESVVPRPDRPSASGSDKPFRPEITRVDDQTILIDSGFMQDSRVRFGGDRDKEEVDRIYACFVDGLEREFPTQEPDLDEPGAEQDERSPFARRHDIQHTLRLIQRECLEDPESGAASTPSVPEAPTPPGDSGDRASEDALQGAPGDAGEPSETSE